MDELIRKWNKIVDIFDRNRQAEERTIQSSWENIFIEYFAYSRLERTIIREEIHSTYRNSRYFIDIALKKNREDHDYLCLVELKREVPFDSEYESQLKEYMRSTETPFGVLICNKIYLYFRRSVNGIESQWKTISIEFKKDNPDGARFVSLLNHNTFNLDEVERFINEKLEIIRSIEQLNDSINAEHIISILKNHYSNEYDPSVVEEVFRNISISIQRQDNNSVINNSQIVRVRNNIVNSNPNDYTGKKIKRFKLFDKSMENLSMTNFYEKILNILYDKYPNEFKRLAQNKGRELGGGAPRISNVRSDITNKSFKLDRDNIYILKNLDNNSKIKMLKKFFIYLNLDWNHLYFEIESN